VVDGRDSTLGRLGSFLHYAYIKGGAYLASHPMDIGVYTSEIRFARNYAFTPLYVIGLFSMNVCGALYRISNLML
jgi:hypothetical protein